MHCTAPTIDHPGTPRPWNPGTHTGPILLQPELSPRYTPSAVLLRALVPPNPCSAGHTRQPYKSHNTRTQAGAGLLLASRTPGVPKLLQEPAAGNTSRPMRTRHTTHHQGQPRAAATSSSTHAQPSTPVLHATPTTHSHTTSRFNHTSSSQQHAAHRIHACLPPRCPLTDRRAVAHAAEAAAMHQTKSKDALRISHKFAQPQPSRFCWRIPFTAWQPPLLDTDAGRWWVSRANQPSRRHTTRITHATLQWTGNTPWGSHD